MIATLPVATAVPEMLVLYFRLAILVTSVAAVILTGGFTWAYRRFIRGYGLLILAGIVSYQLSELYRSAWALYQTGLPLSWAGLFSLSGNLIFFVVCLEPARRKRVRLNQSSERTSIILGE